MLVMHSQLSRCSTARGYSTGLFCVGPTKVKACKSCLYQKFENEKIISQFVRTSKICDRNGGNIKDSISQRAIYIKYLLEVTPVYIYELTYS